jgi:predicted RNase H-like HicB family nuclease
MTDTIARPNTTTMNAADAARLYSVHLEWDPRDDIYVVSVPELPGCLTHGRTREEAVTAAQDAIEEWITVARDRGRMLPPPHLFIDRDEDNG